MPSEELCGMLKGADLDKILDEGYGDAGYHDEVDPEDEAPPKAKAKAGAAPRHAAAGVATAEAGAVPEPFARRAVFGAAPPPAEGAEPMQAELSQAMDEAARERGYKDAAEYSKYLELQQKKAAPQAEPDEMHETPLAPGIKKAPVYMPPGAYPGDRTKLAKEYPERLKYRDELGTKPTPAPSIPDQGGIESTFVKQSDVSGPSRPSDGNVISFSTSAYASHTSAELGAGTIPWALDATARGMKVGDIKDVVGRGEHSFADNEAFVPNTERRWRFELLSIGGNSKDKFRLTTDERIDRANELRLKGNDMFKAGRLLRAMDYYERGSALMDVLEAEELGMPGHVNKEAAEKNQRIWQCQKPLLLNWALILTKFGRWEEAERKCTEVLMDIDKLNVKALFRRGQCHINLGHQQQAQTDLLRAMELDTSIRAEVERELLKVDEMQREVDKRNAPLAKKVVKDLTEVGDARSIAPPSAQPAVPAPGDRLLQELQMQEAASDELDNDSYCRQREAIYNQFVACQPVED